MSEAPSPMCTEPVHKALVKRVSETSTSGSPTSRDTDPTKLRAASSAAAVLKVGTSHTRPVRRSMLIAHLQKVVVGAGDGRGSSRKSRLMYPPRRVGAGSCTAGRPATDIP